MLDTIRQQLPDYAKDIKLNLGIVLTKEGSPDLTSEQIAGIALACALTTKHMPLISALLNETSLDKAHREAARAANAVMAMNNMYYRAMHLINDKELTALPAKLRMNIISNPGIDKLDFELYAVAVSAINGCGMCLEAHTKQLLKHGLSPIAIQSAIRIAAVIYAVAAVLASENSLDFALAV